MTNPLLESRLEKLRDAIDQLSLIVDDNLRSVLLRLTCDQAVASASACTDIGAAARTVRERCMTFLAREHPLAYDLKFAMASLRIGHDYERIQELSDSLNGRIDKLVGTPVQGVMQNMTGVMADILKLHELVRKTWQRDRSSGNVQADAAKLVHAIHSQITAVQSKIMDSISSGGSDAETVVEIVLACRHLKRIATTMEAIPDDFHAFDIVERS